MRVALLSALFCTACAVAPPPREIALPPMPPLEKPDELHAPRPGEIGRDAALADRFTAAGQSVEYAFEARAGELALFSLEAWGYDYGWRARAAVCVLDEAGRAYDAREFASGMAGFDLLAFVAPRDGLFRYRIELREGWFRYRLARRSSHRAHLRGELVELARAPRVAGYLASGEDEVRYALQLAAGERVDLALRHAEPQGRSEQRGRGANVLHPALELTLEGTGEAPDARCGAYLVLPRGTARRCVVRVRTRGGGGAGGGARFELLVAREPRLCALEGVVVDREDRPLAGVELEFLRGADRDCTARAITDAAGRYAAEVTPGPYRVRLGHWGVRAPHGADCVIEGARRLDLVWLDAPISRADELDLAGQ